MKKKPISNERKLEAQTALDDVRERLVSAGFKEAATATNDQIAWAMRGCMSSAATVADVYQTFLVDLRSMQGELARAKKALKDIPLIEEVT